MWGLINHSGPSMVDTLKGECCVPETSINTLQMWCDRPSGCSDPLVWARVCLGDSDDWKVWRVPVNLAKDALRMVSLEKLQDASLVKEVRGQLPTQMAKGVIVRKLSFYSNAPQLCLVEYLVTPFVPCLMAFVLH